MATLLYRLGKTAYRHWPRFIAGWVIVLVAMGALSGAVSKPLTSTFSIPGIPSQQAADLQQELFPNAGSAFDVASVNVVVAAPKGHQLTEKKYAKAIKQLTANLAALPQQPKNAVILGPVEAAHAQLQAYLAAAQQSGMPVKVARANARATSPLTPNQRFGIITYAWDVPAPGDVKAGTIDDLTKVMETARTSGLDVQASGPGSKLVGAGGKSEVVGLAVAVLVLLLTFGSLVSAGLPILIAVIGVGLGLSGVMALTAFMDLGATTPILAGMIGLAVGIDYSLFILARYRTELHHTDDREEAIGVAVGTAGSAVVFAGLTVLIALTALSVVRIPFMTAMGLAAAATVFIAVIAALTLLPALVGLLKSKVFAGAVRKYEPTRESDGLVVNNGVRWARLLGRRPAVASIAVVVALSAIAIPLKDLYLAFATDSSAPSDTTQRKAADIIDEHFGPGSSGRLLLIVDARDVAVKKRMEAFGTVTAWVSKQPDVVNAQVIATNAVVSKKGVLKSPATGAQILITPKSDPQAEETKALLQDLRDGQAKIEKKTGATFGITGLTAITADVADRLAAALPVYLAIIVGLAFVLLMLVFRSILVPLTATLGFLLSMLATLGAVVLFFQKGAFGLIESAPIDAFMPMFLVGMVFGLAMDYQVFLVTRMREAHVHGLSTRDAVVDGFRNSARVVTAAATIMVAVFGSFMLEDDTMLRSTGFALATAIILDAFIVRMVLIPATLYLLGEKAWWLPAWLDRLLPNVDVEGENLKRGDFLSRAEEFDDFGNVAPTTAN